MTDEQSELLALVSRYAPSAGACQTPIPTVAVTRLDQPQRCAPALHPASFCVVAQGSKRVWLDGRVLEHAAMSYLVCSVTLPVEAEIRLGPDGLPYLGVAMQLDLAEAGRVLLELDELRKGPAEANTVPAIGVSPMTDRFIRALTRLLELADDPVRCRVLSPGIRRELYLELLLGAQGATLRQCIQRGAQAQQVAKVISYIEAHYREPLEVEDIARIAGMGTSAFHLHFKQATTMSPMQYVKHIRLHRARALLSAGHSVGGASADVGYISPSQFSREFRRLFGIAPIEQRQQAARTTKTAL